MKRQRLYSIVIREQNRGMSRIPFLPAKDPEVDDKNVPRMRVCMCVKSGTCLFYNRHVGGGGRTGCHDVLEHGLNLHWNVPLTKAGCSLSKTLFILDNLSLTTGLQKDTMTIHYYIWILNNEYLKG